MLQKGTMIVRKEHAKYARGLSSPNRDARPKDTLHCQTNTHANVLDGQQQLKHIKGDTIKLLAIESVLQQPVRTPRNPECAVILSQGAMRSSAIRSSARRSSAMRSRVCCKYQSGRLAIEILLQQSVLAIEIVLHGSELTLKR